ncbi:unnamed protein product [Lupinus luteus]|uniref:Tyrosine-protein kinase catalytic domain-containing protein n=1 Tax=Lupinus luteus TaxID=3873 RepID=A0AAV1X606_LUPLU
MKIMISTQIFDPAKINAQNFTFRELATATKNFRHECLIGEEGFGRVYKGIIPATGKAVAVKQLDRNGMQECKDFLVEVWALSLLHHENLVSLIGYCADGDQHLLVYEFIQAIPVEDRLFVPLANAIPPPLPPVTFVSKHSEGASESESEYESGSESESGKESCKSYSSKKGSSKYQGGASSKYQESDVSDIELWEARSSTPNQAKKAVQDQGTEQLLMNQKMESSRKSSTRELSQKSSKKTSAKDLSQKSSRKSSIKDLSSKSSGKSSVKVLSQKSSMASNEDGSISLSQHSTKSSMESDRGGDAFRRNSSRKSLGKISSGLTSIGSVHSDNNSSKKSHDERGSMHYHGSSMGSDEGSGNHFHHTSSSGSDERSAHYIQ